MHWNPHLGPHVFELFKLIYTYSYLILYPLVVIEGPVITVIAGFLASTGFLDPLPAFLTILAGNLTGDILYYSAGRWWFNKSIKKLTDVFKVSRERVSALEEKLKHNSGKILFFGKLSHVVSGLVLVVSGVAEIPIKKYLWFCFLAEVPKSLILLSVGFFFGSTVSNYGKYINYTLLGLVGLTVILIGLYGGVNYIASKFISKDEKSKPLI